MRADLHNLVRDAHSPARRCRRCTPLSRLQEEDRIIIIEVGTLKKLLLDRTLTGKRLREFLIRLVYVEMLGHDASFGYMKTVEVGGVAQVPFDSVCVPNLDSLPSHRLLLFLLHSTAPTPHFSSLPQLSASTNLTEKRVAYLTAALCFSPDHEFRMMLVNRLQRDLQSPNVLEASIALSAAAKLLTTDMIPAVLPIVANLLRHDQEIIRKKAVMLLQRFHSLQADSVSTLGEKFRRALCDKDPSVMGASLHLFLDLAKGEGKEGRARCACVHTMWGCTSILPSTSLFLFST